MSARIVAWMRGDRAVALRAHPHVVDLVAAVRRRLPCPPSASPSSAPARRACATRYDISASSPYMFSFEPKPPPTSGAITRKWSSAMPSMPASCRRTRCGTCVDVQSVRLPARYSAITPRGSIARAGDPVVHDPPLDHDVGLREPCLDVAAAERPLVRLVRAELLVDERASRPRAPSRCRRPTGSGSYSTITSSAASWTAYLSSPTTTATGSPTWQTLPRASGQCSGVLISTPGGAHAIGSGAPQVGHVLAGEHACTPGARLGCGLVDRDDLRVRLRRADDRRVEAAGELDVVDVTVPPPRLHGDVVAQVLPSGPDYPGAGIENLIVASIHTARDRVVIATPYFVPSLPLLDALQTAVLRGVKVHLIVSQVTDQELVRLAQRSYYAELMAAGVRIRLYRDKLLHAKNIAIDDDVAIIGSSNVDIRSFVLNSEVTMRLLRPRRGGAAARGAGPLFRRQRPAVADRMGKALLRRSSSPRTWGAWSARCCRCGASAGRLAARMI